jgi:hypothetical protein
MSFDVGDSVPLAWDVKDAAGVLVNASTIVLTVTRPDGTAENPSVPAPGTTGQYRVTYVPATEGRYSWRAVTTGPSTAYQDVFEVREQVSPALVSLADAKTHLNIPAATTTFDEELREYLEGITRVVEQYVGPIVRRTYTRRVCGYRYSITLPHTQVLSITAITLVMDGSSPITIADLSINSEAGIVTYKNGSLFPWGEMDWTYQVGRSYVQPNWTLAAKMILDHNWKSQLGNLPSIQGDEDRGYIFPGQEIPPRAEMLLAPDSGSAGFA